MVVKNVKNKINKIVVDIITNLEKIKKALKKIVIIARKIDKSKTVEQIRNKHAEAREEVITIGKLKLEIILLLKEADDLVVNSSFKSIVDFAKLDDFKLKDVQIQINKIETIINIKLKVISAKEKEFKKTVKDKIRYDMCIV